MQKTCRTHLVYIDVKIVRISLVLIHVHDIFYANKFRNAVTNCGENDRKSGIFVKCALYVLIAPIKKRKHFLQIFSCKSAGKNWCGIVDFSFLKLFFNIGELNLLCFIDIVVPIFVSQMPILSEY